MQIIHNEEVSVSLREAPGSAHRVLQVTRGGPAGARTAARARYTQAPGNMSAEKGHREVERVKVHPCTTGRSPRWSEERGWRFLEASAATPQDVHQRGRNRNEAASPASQGSTQQSFVHGATRRGFDIHRQHRHGPG